MSSKQNLKINSTKRKHQNVIKSFKKSSKQVIHIKILNPYKNSNSECESQNLYSGLSYEYNEEG